MTLLLAASVFSLVVLATLAYLPLGQRLRHWDHPNARSAHELPTLSSGGIAIVVGLLLGLGTAALNDWLPLAWREVQVLLLVAAVCVIGLLDDRRPLPVWLRLALFLLLSVLLVRLYLPAAGLPLLLLLALAVAWLLNLYNFMDGIDGIAALQCLCVAAALAVLGSLGGASAEFVVVALAVAAAYAAFLCFNWPPAQVFMGDAGSLSAGMLLGWLGLWGWVDGGVHPLLWLLLMSPFLVDTAITLCLRLWRRERITQAHNQHAYQRLARHFRSHRAVDLGLLALQLLWLWPLAWLALAQIIPAPVALFLGLIPQLAIMAKAVRLQ